MRPQPVRGNHGGIGGMPGAANGQKKELHELLSDPHFIFVIISLMASVTIFFYYLYQLLFNSNLWDSERTEVKRGALGRRGATAASAAARARVDAEEGAVLEGQEDRDVRRKLQQQRALSRKNEDLLKEIRELLDAQEELTKRVEEREELAEAAETVARDSAKQEKEEEKEEVPGEVPEESKREQQQQRQQQQGIGKRGAGATSAAASGSLRRRKAAHSSAESPTVD